MKIEAVCTRVTSRPYTNQRGVTMTYYDATWMDAEADPMKRFPGLVYTKPTEEDIKTHCIGEGSRLSLASQISSITALECSGLAVATRPHQPNRRTELTRFPGQWDAFPSCPCIGR